MNPYYADLYASKLAHVQAGWRHPFEQAARFILASDLPQVRGGALLDIGCGPGDFFGHLQHVEWFGEGGAKSSYLGVDRLQDAVDVARSRWPEARFVCEDIMSSEFSQTAETVVAIGAMISGEPCSRSERVRRVGQFVARCIACSTHQGVIIMLEEGGLQARASLGLESALFGVWRGEELDALCTWLTSRFEVKVTVHPQGLGSDVTLYWQRDEATCLPIPLRDNEALANEVFDRIEPREDHLYWRGWLCAELGLIERACQELERCMRQGASHSRERARLLQEHLLRSHQCS